MAGHDQDVVSQQVQSVGEIERTGHHDGAM